MNKLSRGSFRSNGGTASSRRMSELVIEMKSVDMGGEKEKVDHSNDSPVTKGSPTNIDSDKWTPSPLPEEEKDTGTLTGKQVWFSRNGMIY